MGYERTHLFQQKSSHTPQPTSQFSSRPFEAPVQMKPKEQMTPDELENEAFNQHKFEAFGLQLKEKNGTITPVEQERLGVLQAKMDDFWAQRRERASRFSYDFSKIPVHPPEGYPTPRLQPMWRQRKNGVPREDDTAVMNTPQPLLRLPIQAKLTIGEPGDKYEQEADAVAARVVEQINAPATAQSTPGQSVQRQSEEETEEVRAKPEISARQRMDEPNEEEIQGKFIQKAGEATIDLDKAINSARSGGQPLDAGLQQSMGQAMGADFSGVRVHTDAQADELNQSIQAKAFTTGQDVFFRQGVYEPGSRGGQELIAHELTHVVQQNAEAVRRSLLPQQPLPQKSSDFLVIGSEAKAQTKLQFSMTNSKKVEKRLNPNVSQSIIQRVVHESFLPESYIGATSHVNVSGLLRAFFGFPVPPAVLDSQILRENLTWFSGVPDSNNSPVSTRNQAHHIVEMNDANAAPARQLLALAGIDLNSAINGVLLPIAIADDTGDATVHVGSHVQQYAINVNQALDDAINHDPAFMAVGRTAAWLRALVVPLPPVVQVYLRGIISNRLSQIRTFLLTHHIPINKGCRVDEDFDPDEDRGSGGKPIGKSFAEYGLT